MTLGILSLLPPLIAIGLAVWKKQILPSIFLGIWVGEAILSRGELLKSFSNSITGAQKILGDRANLEIILFSLLAGSFLELIKKSQGISGFIHWFEKKRIFQSRKSVYPVTFLLNVSLFMDSWSSMLITGSIMRPIYTKMKISRERLAYFLHTTSINVAAVIVLNCWGAYYMSLLRAQNVADPLKVVLNSIPFNYYCLGSLILVAVVMATGFTFGPMKNAELRPQAAEPLADASTSNAMDIEGGKANIPPRALNMVFPTILLITLAFAGLFVTGGGNLIKGSGSTALFYAAIITLGVSSAVFIIKRYFTFQEIMDIIFKGMADLLPIGALLVLALALGDVCKRMGTGIYLAEAVKHNIPIFLFPAIVFAISCIISFATGTSYGTFAIMVPIAIPIALMTSINPALIFGACISGGVFGDNCSPISDTSIIASLVTGVPVVDHIKTQIPYALIVASLAFLCYVFTGIIMN